MRYSNALIIDSEGHALILRRSGGHPRYAFHADLPGGIIEDDETHEGGVLREIFEETGIVISSDDLVETYMHIAPTTRVEQSLYIVRLSEPRPEVSISWEHDQFNWVPISAIEQIEGSVRGKIEKIVQSGFLAAA